MPRTDQTNTPTGIQKTALMTTRGITWVAAIFTLTVAALLIANAVATRASDPLELPQLEQLRETFKKQAKNQPVIDEARQLDLLARHAFFSSQTFVRRGGKLLLIGAIVLLISANLAYGLKKRFPYPGPYAPDESSLRVAKAALYSLKTESDAMDFADRMTIRCEHSLRASSIFFGQRSPPFSAH